MFVLGIDIGTQGAHALIADLDGRVVAEAHRTFARQQTASTQPGRFEQAPELWRTAMFDVVSETITHLIEGGHPAEAIAALSVTSTSGTLCLVDAQGEPVGPAIMYSDVRADAAAEEVQAAGTDWAEKLGTRFNASFALSKLRWIQQNEPGRLERARWCLSPADLLIGWLCGEWGHTDWTNALKWGYDVIDLRWPDFIAHKLGLPLDKFPQVCPPGSVIGHVSPKASSLTGLSPRTLVVAGSTDGTASQLASGAVAPGDWNSTLGTTLVLKGVSANLLRDPLGRIYCHRHPDGYWLPGGASSTGADCLAQRFPAERLPELNEAALRHSPTNLVLYPLVRRGERLPFSKPDAMGFTLGEANDEEIYFTAHLEGLAYVERLAYEVVQGLGATVGDTLYVAGGGTRSMAGLQIRSDVLGKVLRIPEVPAGAMGAAILAGRGCAYQRVMDAATRMVRYAELVEPRTSYRVAYEERYQRFVAACRERGYLP